MDVSATQGGTVKIDQTIPTTYPAILTVNSGVSVRLEAIPASGYEFTGWNGDLTSQDNPATLVISCNKEVIASFSQKTHRLNIQVKGAGSVVPSAGAHSYVEGTVVDITATPDTGYRFDGWTGEMGDASSASTTVTMDSDETVIATSLRSSSPGCY